jgi:hypothetical protein
MILTECDGQFCCCLQQDQQPLEQTEAPDVPVAEDTPLNTATTPRPPLDTSTPPHPDVPQAHNATHKNETDKKGLEELVHVPLTLSTKRETALMRLTNRIKALELNVSLSSR